MLIDRDNTLWTIIDDNEISDNKKIETRGIFSHHKSGHLTTSTEDTKNHDIEYVDYYDHDNKYKKSGHKIRSIYKNSRNNQRKYHCRKKFR